MCQDKECVKGIFRTTDFVWIMTVVIVLVFSATCSYSRDASFAWTANAESVDGYRLYYKTGSSGAPYNGVGAVEGSSPIIIGNTTTYTLHGLSDTETYYFVLTAYLGAEESVYSTELVFPPGTSGRTVSFVWTANPETVEGYRLHYKTGSSGAPYNGTGADEGPSPRETGGSTTSYVLHGLSATETYYFALSAFSGSDESALSAELVLPPSQVNSAPIATGANISIIEDTPYSGQLSGSDADGDPLTFSIVTNGSRGTAVVSNSTTGAFTYTPNTNVSGTDSFTFRVYDGTVYSSSATMNVSISAVNDVPLASGAAITVVEDTLYSGQLTGSDADGNPLSFRIITNGSKGTATINNITTGAFTYVPNANLNGSDSFTFVVNDGSVDSVAATVSISITAVNDPPVASGSSFSVDEDSTKTGQLTGSDPEGSALTFVIVTGATKGSVILTNPATGAFTYTPDANKTGTDAFTFRVTAGGQNSSTATVSITIVAKNDTPVATGASIVTDENTAYSGQLSATDIDGDALTFSIVTNGTKGTAAITNASSGAFTYTPQTNKSGTDLFTFRVNDGTVNSAAATVNVTINLVNAPPVVADISMTTDRNTAVGGRLLAHDEDGDTLTYSIVSPGSKGTVAITDAGTGSFTYTPDADVVGEDTFRFRVNDGLVNSADGTVRIEILDETILTAVFGDNYGTDYPGAVGDTYITDISTGNSTAAILRSYSLATQPPHKVANTIVMKIDVSQLPSYATIIEAELVLYQSAANGDAQYSNTVHKISGKNPVIAEVSGVNAAAGQPWTAVPTGTTYKNVPLGVADVEPAEDEQLLFTAAEYRSWRITNMVQDWVALPSTNFGLLLKGGDAAVETGRVFASSQNSNQAIRPQVIVRYKLIPRAPRLIMLEEIKD